MGKKQHHPQIGLSQKGVNIPKRLKSGEIKSHFEELSELPMGAILPDWSRLTSGNRFAIAVRFISPALRLKVLGKSKNQIDRYKDGDSNDADAPRIPDSVMAALADQSKLPIEWLKTGAPMQRLAPVVRGSSDELMLIDEDVPLQKLAFKVAAGRGALMMDDAAGYVRFPRAILDHVGVAAQHARLMEASGESMKPTIHDGDLLLIDISKAAQIVEGKIYVFAIGNEAYVKRLRRAGAKVIMISDNRDMFPPEDAPEEPPMTIYGMVRWTGRSL